MQTGFVKFGSLSYNLKSTFRFICFINDYFIIYRGHRFAANRVLNKVISLSIKFVSQTSIEFLFAIDPLFVCLRTIFTRIGRPSSFAATTSEKCLLIPFLKLVPHFHTNINNYLVDILVCFFFHSEYPDIISHAILRIRISTEQAGQFTSKWKLLWVLELLLMKLRNLRSCTEATQKRRFMNRSSIFWDPGMDLRHTAISVQPTFRVFNQV